MVKDIEHLLGQISHPETNISIVESSIVDKISVEDQTINISLVFKGRDPLAGSLRKAIEATLKDKYPLYRVAVVAKEISPTAKPKVERTKFGDGISRIIAVSSGKGGVGKSTVAVNLAVTLASQGYKVGFLDSDIYGPSAPKMFGLESHQPMCDPENNDLIMPAERFGIKINSIGFFIQDSDALAWRGPMATNALRQLIRQTSWGELDYLICDMPPGTGDIHLTIMTEMRIDGAVIVSTPHNVAVADVVRGVEMFRSDNVQIPIIGIIENMAWFTPKELPDSRYYIFGKEGCKDYAQREGIATLGEIPIIMAMSEGASSGSPAVLDDPYSREYYQKVVENIKKFF